ncbi:MULTISPECIES: inositol-3-phosphate synthase [unclassified Pseudactinotalea]|uniref:inositol-3-phosphate synthase n=1 Tax=unclassified Pseudactinotalea TaxID=2649176 RepID=UPI00128B9F5E|nr:MULTISPECIES: inositol-3-phosphate synthase [unclassified Pseudactinotalea]MPV51465.1 myo-inositol-1-phosphate synthase [Pseudactinotalea sp. HY160]QGH70039.1 myo-inositol-1-phosphate synthase [Pseudactinotalea sp. HY158]
MTTSQARDNVGTQAGTARTGIWFVGARGSVATTATIGTLAVSAGLSDRTGLVSELEPVAAAGLLDVGTLVTGGHDVSSTPLTERAQLLADSGVFPTALVRALDAELGAADARIRLAPQQATQRAVLDAIEADIRAFQRDNDLARVIVVDVSNTEAPAASTPELDSLAALESALDAGAAPLPQSSAYAYAAYRAGCPLVAFTPSPGPAPAALGELAEQQGLPWAGRDGKTGETLVKTTLAPMFATRNLAVRSWASYNLLGGGDGQALADPVAVASKTATKGAGVDAILGHHVDGPLRIDYVEDLGDWKTAWDHVSFEGFLGTRMTMQFTWQGCDSALAAPLVLDLVRLVARAHEAGQVGVIGALSFFFKEPMGSGEHSISAQWTALTDWCAKLALPA